jgi:hypothetical protein
MVDAKLKLRIMCGWLIATVVAVNPRDTVADGPRGWFRESIIQHQQDIDLLPCVKAALSQVSSFKLSDVRYQPFPKLVYFDSFILDNARRVQTYIHEPDSHRIKIEFAAPGQSPSIVDMQKIDMALADLTARVSRACTKRP